MDRPAKISNFQLALQDSHNTRETCVLTEYELQCSGAPCECDGYLVADKQILRLDVTMDDVLGMAVLECTCQLSNVLQFYTVAETSMRCDAGHNDYCANESTTAVKSLLLTRAQRGSSNLPRFCSSL